MVLTCMVPDLEVSRNGSWNGVGWGLKALYSGHQAQLPVREGRGRTWECCQVVFADLSVSSEPVTLGVRIQDLEDLGS